MLSREPRLRDYLSGAASGGDEPEYVPEIPLDVIAFLREHFPTPPPELGLTLEQHGYRAGVESVVQFLEECHERQKAEALEDLTEVS